MDDFFVRYRRDDKKHDARSVTAVQHLRRGGSAMLVAAIANGFIPEREHCRTAALTRVPIPSSAVRMNMGLLAIIMRRK